MLPSHRLDIEFARASFALPDEAGWCGRDQFSGTGGSGAMEALSSFTGAAWRLERSLAESRAGLAAQGAALDRIGHGVIIVDGNRHVLFANQPAKCLAETGGIRLEREPGTLSADVATEAAGLAARIADAAHGGGGGSLRLSRPSPLGKLAATVSPLPVAAPGDAIMVLVALRDLTATADIAPSQLMELFGLTAAEAAIVPQLVEGETAHVIARGRGVAVATVRAQAARILAKTGAPNLRALAMMVAALSVSCLSGKSP
jgi:DNA-binding CsgD family transcriptional regulator